MKEIIERDGRKWSRHLWGARVPGFFTSEDEKMELRCPCWVDAGLNVFYGEYEVFAECRSCHLSESIYSG
jgi:hypothetical protein